MSAYSCILAAFLSSILLETVAINRTDFFGEYVQDVTPHLIQNDDDSSLGIKLSVPYPFFDTPRSIIFVNNNGALTFTTRATIYSQIVFPNNPHQLIAQYWGDVDTRGGSGNVWYMETTDLALRTKARDYIQRGFVTEKEFLPSHLFIATWDRVGYFEENSDKTNTFQCILATDSVDLYVIFLYADIQWTTGDSSGGTDGLGGNPAQVGFNAGDGDHSYSLPGSRTDDIVNIDERSNVDVPGVWVFHVSGPEIRSGGCSKMPESLTLSPSHGNILGGETISVAGPCFDPNTQIQCEFGDITRSAIYISQQEVLCIAPQLSRSGRVNFRLLINGVAVSGQYRFTSIPLEKAHQVDVITPTNTVNFSAESTVELQWNPLSVFPRNSSSDFQVTISMHRLNLENGEWELMHTFTSNSPNDGQESVTIPRNLDRNIEILPVVFQVAASVNPVSTVQSGTLYTRLVMSGQKAGRWSSQYYYVNPLVATQTSYYLCQSWYENEPDNTGSQLLEMNTPCPPQEAQARAPNSGLVELDYTSFYGNSLYRGQWLRTFHQDVSTCFTSGELRSSLSSSSQECCYDGSGRLVTGAPGGGSVHKMALAKSRVEHFREDVRPYLLCCTGYAPSCQRYYERRPSDNGSRYQPPLPAWVFGDPHLVTLDGHKYTFNGNGEFTLIRTQNNLFTMQGRMQQFSNVSATVLTAIAARELYSDTVMITNSRRGIDAYVNGERVDLSVIEEQEFQNVTVTRTNDSILSVEFSCGARISVRSENNFLSAMSIVLPPSFHGNSQGLLGVYNGDPTDDLLPENGITPLANTSTRQRIHELFGLTWMLSNREDSLFTYLPYTSFSDLRNPDFTPTYTIDSSSADVSMCGGDEFCIFDVVTTEDSSVGMATLAAVRQIDNTVQMSYPVVCDLPCLNGACVANDTCRCSNGYSGSQCDRIDNPVSCDLNPCASGETCAILAGSYVCTPNCSQDPAVSPLCSALGSGPCKVNHCNNGGVCRPNDSNSYGFECVCPPNYTGRLCDLMDSSCAINPCQNGGICSEDGNTDFTCTCLDGFSGELCENGISMMTIIIIAACAAGVALALIAIIVMVACICIICCCNKSSRGKVVIDPETTGNQPSGMKISTLTKDSTDGNHVHQNGTPSFPSREDSSTPANGVPPSLSNNQPLQHMDPSTSHYQDDANMHVYHEIEGNHDQTPPPPYPDYEEPAWLSNDDSNHSSNQLSFPVQRVQSDSSAINRLPTSGSDSSRSNTTSPLNSDHYSGSSTKVSIERAGSLHKDTMSNRSLTTPSPVPGVHQSHSHQNIPMRSSASTPSGQVGYPQTTKKNYSSTLPHGMKSGQYLSSSTSQISKMRRHSSSSAYQTNIVTDEGSGNLTMVTEV